MCFSAILSQFRRRGETFVSIDSDGNEEEKSEVPPELEADDATMEDVDARVDVDVDVDVVGNADVPPGESSLEEPVRVDVVPTELNPDEAVGDVVVEIVAGGDEVPPESEVKESVEIVEDGDEVPPESEVKDSVEIVAGGDEVPQSVAIVAEDEAVRVDQVPTVRPMEVDDVGELSGDASNMEID